MKYISCFIFWVFSSFVFGDGNLQAQSQLRAGAARVNITPSLGTAINGDFLPYYTTSIHDSIYAKALAFDDGKKRFVFVVVDCMAIDILLIRQTKKLIKERLGLLPDQVMVASTHAHSCGAVRGAGVCQPDMAYRNAMPEKISKAVRMALKNMQPAKIAWGNIDVPQHLSCRRWYMKPGFPMANPFGTIDKVWMNPPLGSEFLDKPASPTDPQVSYLAVKSLNDKWISVLGNYSIHYAADVPENTISADYFGVVHDQLKAQLGAGDDFIGIMSNGTSGDVNTFDFKLERNYPTEPYGKSTLIGKDVADAIIKNLSKAKFNSKASINFAFKDIDVLNRQPSKEDVARAKKLVSGLDFGSLTSRDKASASIMNIYAIHTLELNEYQEKYTSIPLQAVSIGEGTIGAIPCEVFSETGLKLKKQAPSKYYFTIGLANGEEGYIPPADQFKLGGYETWLCNSSHLAENAEETIRTKLVEFIKEVQ